MRVTRLVAGFWNGIDEEDLRFAQLLLVGAYSLTNGVPGREL